MASAAMATAAGAAALLYYAIGRRSPDPAQELGQEGQPSSSSDADTELRRKSIRLGSVSAPSSWFETIATLSETLRFSYAETLSKWPITDLAFGINFLMKRQAHLQAASVYAGEGSHELKGQEVTAELKDLLILLSTCIHFSKKPFPLFLEATGYSKDCVLLQEPKAGLLKPSFAILVDEKLQCILLLVRGTHSVKDTLTAVTGAVVPFHHTILDEGGVSHLVLGYAHCGMVAAARWIARLATPILLKAQKDNPTYKLKIVGHSLGGGTAALLTYILRERKDLSSIGCVCFGPAACMTWELAESGKPFTTSVISGSDLVPTFSAASIDDLRSEVTASAWVNDFRERVERIRFLKSVLCSTAALSNRLSSIASASKPFYPYLGGAARAGVANAWQPVSSGTQVVMRQAQNVVQAVVRTHPSIGLAGWSCIGARQRTVSTVEPPSSDGQETGERAESLLEVDSDGRTENQDLVLSSEMEGTLLDEMKAGTDGRHSKQESEWSTRENQDLVSSSVMESTLLDQMKAGTDGRHSKQESEWPTRENQDLVLSSEMEGTLSDDVKAGTDGRHSEQESERPTREDKECARLSNEVLQREFLRDHSRKESKEGFGVEIQHLPLDDEGDDDDELSMSQKTDGAPELTEEYLCQQLEKELELQREACIIERQEEEEEAKKITQEEKNVAATAAEVGPNCIMTEPEDGTAQGRELNRFFPPGRIIHLLSLTPERSGGLGEETAEVSMPDKRPRSQVGLYLTDRALYGKVHLFRNMINDHFMPNYKRMMESVIEELENAVHDEDSQL